MKKMLLIGLISFLMLIPLFTASPDPDINAPQYYDNSINNTNAGQPCLFSLNWTDNVGLSSYIFSTNNTGTWTNDSWVEWGNGFNFLKNAVNVTPDTTDSWQDVDVSSYIPSGASGVILELQAPATYKQCKFRKPGSSWDPSFERVYGSSGFSSAHGSTIIPVNSSLVFQAYIQAGVNIWLDGYTDDAVVLLTEPTDATPTAVGEWTDVDLSSDIPAGATGAIIEIIDHDYTFGVRHPSASGEFENITYSRTENKWKSQNWYVIGINSSRFIQAKTSDIAPEFWLRGYTKSPIKLFTNPINITQGATGSWVGYDVTSDTSSTANCSIILIKKMGTWGELNASVRYPGSTDDREYHYIDCATTNECSDLIWVTGMNSTQNFEVYRQGSDINVFLYGYCEPAMAWSNITKTLNSTVGIPIGWRVYANDTSDNWNASEIFTLITTEETAPCTCDSWVNQDCGLGGCLFNKMYQNRTCNPSGCDIEERCVSNPLCGPIGCDTVLKTDEVIAINIIIPVELTPICDRTLTLNIGKYSQSRIIKC